MPEITMRLNITLDGNIVKNNITPPDANENGEENIESEERRVLFT